MPYRYPVELEKHEICRSIDFPGQCENKSKTGSFFLSMKAEVRRGRRIKK
jgi:hypothetical protein